MVKLKKTASKTSRKIARKLKTVWRKAGPSLKKSVNSAKKKITWSDKKLRNFRKTAAEIIETDNEIIARFNLHRMDKENIRVIPLDEGVEITGERKEEKSLENKKTRTYHYERHSTGYYRYLPLPNDIDPWTCKTEYQNGILELRFVKI